jgi:hypothetical protein
MKIVTFSSPMLNELSLISGNHSNLFSKETPSALIFSRSDDCFVPGGATTFRKTY